MKSLAGSVALAVMLVSGPLAAQNSPQQSTVATVPSHVGDTSAAQPYASASSSSQAVATPPSAAPEPTVAPVPVAEPAAAAPPPPPPPITLVLNADLGAQRLTVIENGKTRFTWPISSGRSGFATPTGTFRPQWASKLWHSRQYEYAPMPFAVFFHRGAAFHGTNAVGLLGRPASHGCIRLATPNAATLFKLVHKHGYASTKVVVRGGSKSREPAVASRGSRADLASAQPAGREATRVSRASPRKSTSLDD